MRPPQMKMKPRRTPLPLRLAWRELRAGVAGFRVFLVCLILGVAAIAAITSTTQTIRDSLAREGRNILGADISLRLRHRAANPAELEQLAGLVSNPATDIAGITGMQALAGKQEMRILSRLKAVDDNYPLYGELRLQPSIPLQKALMRDSDSGLHGVALEPIVLQRLGVALGDRIFIGALEAEIRALVLHEPDRLSDGFAFGPRIFLNREAMEKTELMRQGSVFSHHYKLRLGGAGGGGETAEGGSAPQKNEPVCDEARLQSIADGLRARMPESGWHMHDCSNSAPELERFVSILSQFLVLVGLMALIVGGIGVANAVRGYLDAKRPTLATLKCLGAPGVLLFRVYMLQILALTLLGTGIGVLLGALAPLPLLQPLGGVLEIPLTFRPHIKALGLAAACGFLVALGFAVWPLARAREIRAVALFRAQVAPVRKHPRRRYVLLTTALFLALIGLLFAFTEDWRFALWFLGIIGISMLVFWLLARLAMLLAQRCSGAGGGRPTANGGEAEKNPQTARGKMGVGAIGRIALRNIARRGSFAPDIVLALGMGLTLLTTVAMTDNALSQRIQQHLIDEAVAFFFLNVASDEADEFARRMENAEGVLEVARAPILRGRIVRVGGVPASELNPSEDAEWALRGDRGLSYERNLPGDSTLVSGEWWPQDYDGPPLLSLADDIARGLGAGIGDTLTVNVLGRELTAEIANTRDFEWRDIGIHFALIFTPNALQSAPHSYLFTVSTDQDIAREAALQRLVVREYPGVTAIWVREIAEQVNRLAENVGLAIRASSVLSLIIGVVVLGGVMAADHRHRRRESVLWKVLGAGRKRVIAIYALEYVLLASAAALFAALCGSMASWVITAQVIELEWVWGWQLLPMMPIAVLVALFLALIGAWRLLGQRPGTVLREE